MDDRIGQQFGRYRLMRSLGRGGFSEVYLGEHVHIQMQVAIKILSPQLVATHQERFQQEARTIASFEHPHIVRVFDFVVEETPCFLVMSYASNGTLRQRHPKKSRVPLNDVVSYVQQVASALQYAHDRKVIHRDVKPENMLLGSQDQVLLSDFGIAMMLATTMSQKSETHSGTVVYMAPEQIMGRPHRASDQYALGITVYEWLTGSPPFHGSFFETCTQHLYAPVPSLRETNPEIPPSVEVCIAKALSKDPEERFACIQDFALALQESSRQIINDTASLKPSLDESVLPELGNGDPTEIKPPSKSRYPNKSGRSRRKKLSILVICCIFVVLLSIMSFLLLPPSMRPTSIVPPSPSPTVKWTFQTKDPIESSPAIVNGVVYIGSFDHNVYAIDASSGMQKWAFPTGGMVTSSPAAVDGIVYVGSSDKNLYAIDASSGVQKWAFPTGGEILYSSPEVVNGVVYVGSLDKNLYAIDARSGQQKWAFLTGNQIISSPEVANGVVYVSSKDFYVYAIDAQSGQKKWAFRTGGYGTSSPKVVNGVVYVGSWDKKLHAIDASSGVQKWAFQTGGNVVSYPEVIDGVVYVGSWDNNVYAIDAQSGQKKWSFMTGHDVLSSPKVVDGVVYVGSWDKNVYAIDAQSGQQKWAFQTRRGVRSSPVLVNNVLYVGSEDHKVYALRLPMAGS